MKIIDEKWPTIEVGKLVKEAITIIKTKEIEFLPVLSGNKVAGVLKLSPMVLSTLTDVRNVKVELIMGEPNLILYQEDDWQQWSKKVSEPTVVVNKRNDFVGVTTPELINQGFKRTLSMHKERFQHILDSTHNGIMAVDQDGRLTLFNEAAARLLSVQPAKVLGKYVKDMFPNTGLIEVLETGKPQYSQKVTHGEKTFISNRTPLRLEGKLAGAVAVFQDISEITRISSELEVVKELNRELDAVIDCSHDGICITDGDGKILRLNPAFARVTGLKREDFMGESLYRMLEEKVVNQSATIKVIEQKKPITVMQQFNTGKHAIATAYPIFDNNGQVERVVTNVRDVTELNYLKQELEQSRELTNKYEKQLEEFRKQQLAESNIVGKSEGIIQVIEVAKRIAPVDTTVLLLGESGVGKENVAHLVHQLSYRKNKGAFVKINCGAIPGELLESELFGYEPGAFTGAKKEGKMGYFELASGGTLFLDEVADLPLELQVKLLRVLQEQEVQRLGGEKATKIDVRIVAATNKDLDEMIARGEFREDLYYRLNVVPVKIPPLRERKEDIALLVGYYLQRFNEKYGFNKHFTRAALNVMEEYRWPGNVRELANIVERLAVTTGRDKIDLDDLPMQLFEKGAAEIEEGKNNCGWEEQVGTLGLDEILAQVEQKILLATLNRSSDNMQAAERLGVSLSTLNRRIKKYGMQRKYEKK
ncbi:PAS domain S-box-containing protein [Desulfitispora alkaliphila]|uniref:sigma 54-interacting transcriptional regulator n=1 Tax=Desulfitispora alkaliphila TaxID=622674 RepID=UPI003D1A0590